MYGKQFDKHRLLVTCQQHGCSEFSNFVARNMHGLQFSNFLLFPSLFLPLISLLIFLSLSISTLTLPPYLPCLSLPIYLSPFLPPLSSLSFSFSISLMPDPTHNTSTHTFVSSSPRVLCEYSKLYWCN